LGLIALELKESTKAQPYLEEALAIARETRERTLESRAIANLANWAAYIQRDYLTARAYHEQGYALAVELGDRYQQAISIGNLGWVCQMLGDFPSAQNYHQKALLISREVGNLYQETYTLMNLSGVAEAQGDAHSAVEYAAQALELCKKVSDRPSEAWSYLYLGHAFTLMGQFQKAQQAYRQSLDIRNELGQPALATEPMAGLIQVALRMNNISLASRSMEDIVRYLSEGGTLEGTEEPLRVYLACYAVLEGLGDGRATQLLQTAMLLLESQVSQISDEQARRTYIENVPWRRAIEGAWLAKKKT
jgi:tetratricopeptide (TPR) repeat protein